MNILVTGGAGFIGSTVTDRLVAAGHAVTVLDDLSSGTLANIEDARARGATFVRADLRDPSATAAVVSADPEVVVHCAAQVDVRRSAADPIADATTNVLGTLRVLEGARQAGARKVVYATSGGAMYGSLPDGAAAFAESSARRPASPYAVSKTVVLDYLTLYRELYGLDFTALALSNVYGPRQDPLGEGGVVAIFGSRLLAGRECTIFGDGTQTRDFVFVGDVAEAFEAALDSGSGRVVNIGSGRETSVLGLYEALAAAVGSSLPAVLAAERPGEVRRSCLDVALAADVLGWRPTTVLPGGVVTTLNWLASRSPAR